MALGLGFNKTKILQTAEKYVLQGKLPAAIDEYQKILKKDPKDLMTLNTIGDLYVRAGKSDDAVKCFYELAEKSVEAGFVPRAIAVYKRVTKIESEALPALIKLGELYSMQGLLRDAKTHYLQAVEIFMKRRDVGKAREVFERVLLLDMENPRLQRRMAELYAETGKKTEAVSTYLSAAERFLEIREPAETIATLDILQKLDADNAEARAIRGRALLEQGDPDKAIELLSAAAGPGAGKATLESLLRAYKQKGKLDRATEVARQLFDAHDDFTGLAWLAEDLLAKPDTEGALRIYQDAAERLQRQGATAVLIEGLRKILKAESTNIAALELLWGVYRKAGDIGEGRELAEQLAHAYVTSGQLEQAREVYLELVALEPDVMDHVKLLRQVEARLGSESGAPEPDYDAATPMMAMDAAVAPDEEWSRLGDLPPREKEMVKNCLTESELYLTYKQLPRAIETLENGLKEVPGDVSLHEHVLPLYEQTQQYGKAVKCAEALTELYVKVGDGERAARYGELILSYQEKAEAGVGMVQEVALDSVEAGEVAEAAAADASLQEPQVREIDLSMEWASLSEASATPPAATADSAAEEVEFYLQAGLGTEAAAAIGRLREASPEYPSLRSFQERLAVLLPDAAPPEISVEQPVVAAVSETEPVGDPAAVVNEPDAPVETPAWAMASDDAAPLVAEPEPLPAVTAPAAAEPDWGLDELMAPKAAAAPSGFELSLEETAPAAAKDVFASPSGAPAGGAALGGPGAGSAAAGSGSFLDDVFAEFKEDVGEQAAAGEDDLETHYNMGVAFKEMALYDEAIGEFQKVHQLAESAKDYSHVVRCCSLLATCFLEKGMPQLAVQWYQTAINAPGVDAESVLALLYEMGAAQETAGDRKAALKSFMEVYARNIDYRNVAERIRDLQQGS